MIELDSQLSEIKEVDYNSSSSRNSNNNISEKVNIQKEYNINNKSNLRDFNYEKVANNKMQYININVIINSILQLKDILKTNHPLSKYIQYAKPYDKISSIKLDSKKLSKSKTGLILNNINNNNIQRKIPKKLNKEIVNFNSNKIKKSFYFTRMCNIESKKTNSKFIDKIIFLQKSIRGFLSKKIINSNINDEIAKNIISSVLIIQRNFRKFLLRKKSLDNYIKKIINKERNNKANKIIELFTKYHQKNLFLKNLLIKKIVITRHLSAQLIQSTFKSYILRRKVLAILKKQKKCYCLIYPLEANSVEIKIFNKGINGKCKVYEYIKCPIRKYFVTYINKKEIKPGEYLCQMSVDDNIISDKRYKSVNKNNNLYNLIPIGNYIKKKPKYSKKGISTINDPKEKDKKIKDELDNFYFYYYSNEEDKDNSNDISQSQISEKSNKNKINYLNELDEDDPDQVIDISKSRFTQKYNNSFLKSNLNYVKEYTNKKKEKELYENKIKNIYENIYTKKEENDNDSIHNSEYLNYNMRYDILEELSQRSAKSFTSNKSMNINSYSKKTHHAKFKKNENSKNKNLKKPKMQNYNIQF